MATFLKATNQTIEEAFEQYHRENPHIYELYKRFVREIVQRKGKKTKIGSKLIVERIRWELYVHTHTSDDFKINNNYTAYYARKFAADFPDYKHLFNYRNLRAA